MTVNGAVHNINKLLAQFPFAAGQFARWEFRQHVVAMVKEIQFGIAQSFDFPQTFGRDEGASTKIERF